MDTKQTKKEKIEEAVKEYPGAAVNSADNDAESPCLVKERTKTLNNNPENDGNPI